MVLLLAPFYIPDAKEFVTSDEWHSCLKAWSSVLRHHLSLSSRDFETEIQQQDGTVSFLVSYLHELRFNRNKNNLISLDGSLHHDCLAVIHRAWFDCETPDALLLPSFLKDFSVVYGSGHIYPTILERLWVEKQLGESQPFLKEKSAFQQQLESLSPASTERLHHDLLEVRALSKACYQYGNFLMSGTDLLDALLGCWKQASLDTQSKITLVTYAALMSLLLVKEPHLATFLDHIYTLRVNHDQTPTESSLLRNLATTTPFLIKCRHIARAGSSKRFQDTAAQLEKFGKPPFRKERGFKGKENVLKSLEEDQLSRSTAFSQIQELFPDLDSEFVGRLLEEYDNNVEEITANLMDGIIPSHLANASHESIVGQQRQEAPPGVAISPKELMQRRNAFDYDDFDTLHISASKLHIGKRADEDVSSTTFDKTATLAALAALDSDDDERDDTYDAEDVGGAIDIENPEHDQWDHIDSAGNGSLDFAAEQVMFQLWNERSDLFSRKPTSRNSRTRADLRERTGWSDEQIEGWAIMLKREPKRVKNLQEKFSDDYRSSKEDPNDNEQQNDYAQQLNGPETNAHRGGRDQTRGGRGRGRSQRGGGMQSGRTEGNGKDAASDQSTQRARHQKDANKASRGNHNRRALRARKMARGM